MMTLLSFVLSVEHDLASGGQLGISRERLVVRTGLPACYGGGHL
jgi:hypothetical protein